MHSLSQAIRHRSGASAVQGYAALGLAQLAVGAAGVFARYALGGGGPLAVSALRLLLAVVPIAIVAAIVGARTSRPIRDAVAERRFAAAGIALALHFATWITSLALTSVAVSTLIVCTVPLWLAIYDRVVHRRAIAHAPLAFVLAAAGLALIVGAPDRARSTDLLGDALALVGSFAFAAYLVLVRDPRGYTTLRVVTRTYGYAAVLLAVAAIAAHQPPPPLADRAAWAGIAAMAFLSQLVGHTGLNIAVRRISAVVVAMTTLLEPVIAAALAALLLHETVPRFALLGGLLVLAGIVVLVRSERAGRMNAEQAARTRTPA
jgi:drug/metabolite transporter (DMT)-like permease